MKKGPFCEFVIPRTWQKLSCGPNLCAFKEPHWSIVLLFSSTVQTTVQYTPQSQQQQQQLQQQQLQQQQLQQQQGVSSPYQNHARMLQQGYNSPHILQK